MSQLLESSSSGNMPVLTRVPDRSTVFFDPRPTLYLSALTRPFAYRKQSKQTLITSATSPIRYQVFLRVAGLDNISYLNHANTPFPNFKFFPQMSPSAVYTTISRSTELPHLTDNTIIVILGASGNLAKKFLYPSLFKLFSKNLLPRRTAIVGYARTKFTSHDDFFTTVTAAIPNPGDDDSNFEQNLSAYKANLFYFAGSYDDSLTFGHFNEYLEIIESSYQFPERNRVFYLALPTILFSVAVQNLRTHVFSTAGINRIVIAKPIGSNLESARELVQATAEFWLEDESIRICRYLAEEMVKNVLVFRCANKITNGYWEHQQMTHLLTVSLCDYSDFAQDAALLPTSLRTIRRFVHHKVIATSPEVILSVLKS